MPVYGVATSLPVSLLELSRQYPSDEGFTFDLYVRPTLQSLLMSNIASQAPAIELMNLAGKYSPGEDKFWDLATEAGLYYEEHDVITDDGYILTMMRVRSSQTKKGAKVVFLQHGIFSSSDSWIHNDPEKAVGFRLAREGYDVWFGNNRGNLHSLKNIMLDP